MSEQETPEVYWESRLTVRVMRGSLEDGDYREDWANVFKDGNTVRLHLGEDGEKIEFAPRVIEAIYEMYEEIPRRG